MAGKIKIILAVVALLAVVSISAYLMQRENMGNQAPAQNPRTVTLNVSSLGEGRVLVNGSAAEQVQLEAGSIVILEASAEKYWRLREWRVNGTPRGANERLLLFINGPTQVKAVFERVMVRLVILGNASPASVDVNGTVYPLPYNATLPAGTYLEIAPVAEGDLIALDKPLEVRLEEDTEITLRFRKPSTQVKACKGEEMVLVEGDAAKWAIVNGENRTLPVCVPAPVAVKGPFRVPFNKTHSLWLAWYWIEQNGSKWWWSYGINGSTLYLEHGPANVTLHYVLGLKQLPYVVNVWNYTPIEYYVQRSYVYVFEDYGIKLIPTGRHRYFNTMTLLELPREFGLVEVEVRFGARRMNPEYVFSLGIIWLDGDKFAHLPTLGISPNPQGPTIVLLNGTVAKMAWKAGKNWENRYSLHYTGDDPYMPIFRNNPSYWVYWEDELSESWEKGVMLTLDCSLNMSWQPWEVLPDTGRPAIWFGYTDITNFKYAHLWVRGVAP